MSCRSQVEKQHETESKKRLERFQTELDGIGADSDPLKSLSSRIDSQLKIEDFIVKSREANHPKFKAWAPIAVSGAGVVISLAVAYASWLGVSHTSRAHNLEERKVNQAQILDEKKANSEARKATAEIILKASGNTPEKTRANLAALTAVGLLDLSSDQIEKLSSLRPAR